MTYYIHIVHIVGIQVLIILQVYNVVVDRPDDNDCVKPALMWKGIL